MGLFEILMGGGQKRQEYQDFARRYEQGPPWEGYSDWEVLDRAGSCRSWGVDPAGTLPEVRTPTGAVREGDA